MNSSPPLMNFMVFGLGGKSTPAGTKPFTAAEVAVGRTKAFTSVSLIKTRAQIVEKVIQKCGAPASLRLMYPQGASAMPVLAATGKPAPNPDRPSPPGKVQLTASAAASAIPAPAIAAWSWAPSRA